MVYGKGLSMRKVLPEEGVKVQQDNKVADTRNSFNNKLTSILRAINHCNKIGILSEDKEAIRKKLASFDDSNLKTIVDEILKAETLHKIKEIIEIQKPQS